MKAGVQAMKTGRDGKTRPTELRLSDDQIKLSWQGRRSGRKYLLLGDVLSHSAKQATMTLTLRPSVQEETIGSRSRSPRITLRPSVSPRETLVLTFKDETIRQAVQTVIENLIRTQVGSMPSIATTGVYEAAGVAVGVQDAAEEDEATLVQELCDPAATETEAVAAMLPPAAKEELWKSEEDWKAEMAAELERAAVIPSAAMLRAAAIIEEAHMALTVERVLEDERTNSGVHKAHPTIPQLCQQCGWGDPGDPCERCGLPVRDSRPEGQGVAAPTIAEAGRLDDRADTADTEFGWWPGAWCMSARQPSPAEAMKTEAVPSVGLVEVPLAVSLKPEPHATFTLGYPTLSFPTPCPTPSHQETVMQRVSYAPTGDREGAVMGNIDTRNAEELPVEAPASEDAGLDTQADQILLELAADERRLAAESKERDERKQLRQRLLLEVKRKDLEMQLSLHKALSDGSNAEVTQAV